MSPDMCHDTISDIYVDDEVQLHNSISDEVVKQYEALESVQGMYTII